MKGSAIDAAKTTNVVNATVRARRNDRIDISIPRIKTNGCSKRMKPPMTIGNFELIRKCSNAGRTSVTISIVHSTAHRQPAIDARIIEHKAIADLPLLLEASDGGTYGFMAMDS